MKPQNRSTGLQQSLVERSYWLLLPFTGVPKLSRISKVVFTALLTMFAWESLSQIQ